MTENDQNAKIKAIQTNVDETRRVMERNIEDILERGENIERLHESTHQLVTNAKSFKDESTRIRRQMGWRKHKLTIIIVICVILALLVFGITIYLSYAS